MYKRWEHVHPLDACTAGGCMYKRREHVQTVALCANGGSMYKRRVHVQTVGACTNGWVMYKRGEHGGGGIQRFIEVCSTGVRCTPFEGMRLNVIYKCSTDGDCTVLISSTRRVHCDSLLYIAVAVGSVIKINIQSHPYEGYTLPRFLRGAHYEFSDPRLLVIKNSGEYFTRNDLKIPNAVML